MSMTMGRYCVIQTEEKLTIQFPDADENGEVDLNFKIMVFAVWALISFGFLLFWIFMQGYGQAVLFFLIFGVGGLYLCIGLLKRSEVQFFHLVLDAEGVHEIWTDPKALFQKDITWEQLVYYGYLQNVACVGGRGAKKYYDCIVFSTEDKLEKMRKIQIRKVFNSSMQYEIKFKEVPNNIFLILSGRGSEEIAECIYSFVTKYVKVIEEP